MKKIFLLFLLFVSSFSFAQINHMEFKGIPIDGKIDSFVLKLRQKGFKNVDISDTGISDDTAVMSGRFAGRDCTLIILSTPNELTVCKVVAYTKKNDSWYSVKNEYFKFKELYTKKYGEPTKHYEFFSDPYYEGDGCELSALKHDNCTYASYWSLNNGTVAVEIDDDATIKFVYEDSSNMNTFLFEKEEKQLDDI